MSEASIPTADDILGELPAVVFQHHDLLRAQAAAVISGAIRNGENPAVIATAFAAELVRQVADDHADVSEYELAEMIAFSAQLMRGVAIGKALAEAGSARAMKAVA